jgi:hypothetical protein
VLVHRAAARRTVSGANAIEGRGKVMRIAGAFSPFGREDAADLGRMCVKADRQPDIYLERHARDVGAEPAANVAARSMLFTAVATG